MDERIVSLICPGCAHSFSAVVRTSEHSITDQAATPVVCPLCSATHIYELGELKMVLTVEGSSADEVKDVATELMKEMGEKEMPKTIRNPWISGSFYLATILVIGTLFLVVSKMVHPLAFPVILVSTLLGVSLVGAFQLKQDKSLSQRNFLYLMALTFRQLPFIRKQSSDTELEQK